VRSLASALSANPLAVVVPCHRIVGSAGQLAGYAWGTQRKAWLLNHEQSSLQGSLF
jgi:O-6-methylguanine DNA methyltransferase